MRPTDILSAEHRVIEQVLDCLDRVSSRCTDSSGFDAESALEAIDFLQHFADQCHHGKEEGHLFPLLEARGLPHCVGPTAVMREEHEQGRRYLSVMAATIEPAKAGDHVAREKFVAYANAYTRLLRDHIHKEDHCLFTMATNLLNEEDCQTLLGAFQGSEHDIGEGVHEHYLEVAHRVADRLGVRRSDVPGHCCGQAVR
jgi:hemerythrin-like domain-containing protein